MSIVGPTFQTQATIMTTVNQNNDGTISINYNPRERGIHELNFSYNEKVVDGETPYVKKIIFRYGTTLALIYVSK